MAAAVGIIAIDGGAARILTGVDVRARAHRDVHLLPFPIEQDGARPVPAAEALERYHLFARAHAASFGIVLITLDRLRFADVEILVPESQSEGTVEPGDQLLPLFAF